VALPRKIVSTALLCALSACAPRVPFGDDRAPIQAAAGGAAGAAPSPTLAALPAKTAVNLGPYACTDLPGSGYPCQTIDDYSRFVYDRVGQQLLWFGGGNHATSRTDVAVFSLDTLRWTSAYEPTPCSDMVPDNADLLSGAWKSSGQPMSRQTFDMLVMAENVGELLMLTYNAPGNDCGFWPADAPSLEQVPGRVAHYRPSTRSWRFSQAPANTWQADAAAEYDPESGLVLVLGTQDLWTYDPRLETVQHRLHFELGERFGYAAELVYFPPNGRFYYFTRTGLVFEVTARRDDWAATSISELTDLRGDLPAADAKGWAYDPFGHSIGGGVRDSVLWELDPSTHVFSATPLAAATGDGPGNLAFFTLDYAEQAGVFLFFTDYASGWSTWAYRN
jgi:hypothetical protein